ncbi:MAG: hypothetical protein V4538_07850 [Bacteroidota bacterium]
MSYSYKEFPKDVLNAFDTIIKKYNLAIEQSEDCYVTLSNSFVEISFSFERGDLYSELGKKDDDFTFAIFQVYKHLYGNQAEDNYQVSKIGTKQFGYPKTDLIWFAKLFENELSSVMTGNFDWYKELRTEKEYEKQLVAVILGPHLNYEHPIKQKFWKGDSTWRQDIEYFIKENNIELESGHNSTLPKVERSWRQKLLGFK